LVAHRFSGGGANRNRRVTNGDHGRAARATAVCCLLLTKAVMNKRIPLTLALLIAMVAPAARAAEPRRIGTTELTPETTAAIDQALRWLAANGNEDGSWGSTYRVAETSAALMAFMLKGEFPGRGMYGARLDKAVTFLVRRGQEQGGYLGGKQQGMYEHGLATLALSEVWGESDKDEIKDVLKKAVEVTLRSQNREGGWRYSPQPTDADISVTVIQIVALASAKEAGIHVPDSVLTNAVIYVQKCQHPLGGFAYQPGGVPGFARSAAGVMSLFMAGQRNTTAAARGLDYLIKAPDTKFSATQYYFYAHYYAMQALYQAGDDARYRDWYTQIRDQLLKRQRQDGAWPASDGGTTSAFSTGMACLILGVPYRFLPIYQR